MPWFIPGFLVMAALGSLEFVPEGWIGPITAAATMLTVLSMAALGLAVDLRAIGRVGERVTAAVTLSLGVLLGLSIVLVRLFD